MRGNGGDGPPLVGGLEELWRETNGIEKGIRRRQAGPTGGRWREDDDSAQQELKAQFREEISCWYHRSDPLARRVPIPGKGEDRFLAQQENHHLLGDPKQAGLGRGVKRRWRGVVLAA
jgi:hypothetical protein